METREREKITTCLLTMLWRDHTVQWLKSQSGVSQEWDRVLVVLLFFNLCESPSRAIEIMHMPVA